MCIYCAWGALAESERETETERERERRKRRHLGSAEIGDEFALFLAKNSHVSSSPFKWHWVHTFHFQNFALRFASLKWRDRWSNNRNNRSNFRLHHSSHRKKRIKLIPKTIGIEKRGCAWGCARGINTHLRKSSDRKAQIRKAFIPYRIMYQLAVCSDGMTEAQPRSFRQNRPASEYIIWHNAHSPANRCSGCSNTCTWKRKKCRLITTMHRSQDRFRHLLP